MKPQPQQRAGPPTRTVLVILGIVLGVLVLFLGKGISKEMKMWLWGPRFVIENQSGQLISTATITILDGNKKAEAIPVVQFHGIPAGDTRSGYAKTRRRSPSFSVQGLLAAGKSFTAFNSSMATSPQRIIIKPGGQVVFGEATPARKN